MKTLTPLFLSIIPVLSPASAVAQISPDSPQLPVAGFSIDNTQIVGDIARARQFIDAGQFLAAADQLDLIYRFNSLLSPDQKEEYDFIRAAVAFHRDQPDALSLLDRFSADWAQSPRAVEARLMGADLAFLRHDWPAAVIRYDNINLSSLSPDSRARTAYRHALTLIKTGYFRQARPLLRSLKTDNKYAEAARFYSAYLDYIDGDLDRAADEFARIPAGDPFYPDFYLTQIEYRRGHFHDALSRAKNLLSNLRSPIPAESIPDEDEFLAELNRIAGMSLFRLGDEDAARLYLDRYLSLNPDNPLPDARYALGVADYRAGEFDKALNLFATLTDANDDLAQSAWLFIGQCRLSAGDSSGAAIAFEKAADLNIDPKVTETAWYNYATAATAGAHIPFASGAARLEEFVRRYPDSAYAPEVEAYLANAYYNERNYSRALECINLIRRPSVAVLETKQKVLYELGVDALSNGKPAEAVAWLEKSLQLEKYSPEVARESRLWLGDALYARKDFRRAAEAYRQYLRAVPAGNSRPLAFYDLGYAEYKSGNYKASAEAFKNALALGGLTDAQTSDARLRRADCLYYLRDYAAASLLFAEEPASDYALYRRAVIEGLRGNQSEKERLLSSLPDRFPESRWLSPALLELALFYEGKGDAAKAADAYRRRLDVANEISPDELMRMAETMHAANRWDDLAGVSNRLRASGALGAEDLAQIDLYEADGLAAQGNFDKAEPIYSRLADNPASLTGAKAAVALASKALEMHDFSRAEQLMTDFTNAGTPHAFWLAKGFILLADAYAGLGQQYLAKEYLLSLKENYPGNEQEIFDDINSRLKNL